MTQRKPVRPSDGLANVRERGVRGVSAEEVFIIGKALPEFDDQAFAFERLEKKHMLVAPGVSFNVAYRNAFREAQAAQPPGLTLIASSKVRQH